MDLPASPDPLAAARALGPAIGAAADAIETTRRIPPELAAALHGARLCRMLLPRSLGGGEVHPATYLLAIEELSRHDASIGWCAFVANSAALIAAHLGPAEAAAIFGPPDSLVAWGPPNGTVAEAVPGGYRVSGQFAFASGSRLATWMGVHCPVREPDGTLRQNRHGRPAIRTLLFPAAEAELLDDWHAIGLRGTASEGYRVEGLFVPERFSATREVPEGRREPGALYAFTQQGLYAVGAAGVALGLSRAMLDRFAALASAKTPRGRSLLAADPLVQDGFAKAEAGIGAARAWLREMLEEMVAAAPAEGALGIPARARLRLGCAQAIQAAVEAADWAHRAAGIDAIRPGSPLERRFRDIHTVSQQIQARRAHFAAAGQVLLGQPVQDFL
ncbi:acyl-CoA dehydrogenase family protein [Siccirubricoccus sp. KC 17139]|uniref:Acyl-CoA dehydrogenase family protein n=1 Tax=Siccirubricoccus soli TaxID=2899147 RepID=A0ABT1DB00_9PROT|nr:acyl-CoA dehydrogenase family protein [Siccirubricoccus soli]MCO6419059.1 acyl-CoA dehydrogenase family protein [Siccirubricoccus soli]MCP2685194.1 acyl-CoA dehydrogenase family protein [Siccirubricoccus soli]